jgi:hypothetical protein
MIAPVNNNMAVYEDIVDPLRMSEGQQAAIR